ncbi:S9 family peptidase [Steroidobacter sp.]|uniref:S9 family peptidase n=1 Tax=Steroidobacter sp. TaxID=1978227 RepID=UPI001A599448|nr:S9 family peptidase [Steroidobacter sp.]MBL8271573.1 S9 family peptidase [Steroidobacter sp.]
MQKSMRWEILKRACGIALASCCLAASASAASRALSVDDLGREQEIYGLAVSPDGKWIVYTLEAIDQKTQKTVNQVWKASCDGRQRTQLTQGPFGAGSARWSPDGRYLSFLSARFDDEAVTQVWVLERDGGEAQQLTHVADGVSAYEWSPDSQRLALVITPKKPKPHKVDGKEEPEPIVIDRYQFKSDRGRYHDAQDRPGRVHLYEIASGQLAALTTTEQFAESNPAWSPDGKSIAFVSNREPNWDRTNNTDVWVASARPGSQPRRLTNYPGEDMGPLAWSPDGRMIAYVQGPEVQHMLYHFKEVALVPAQGGEPVLPTRALDRETTQPRFSDDGRFIDFVITDSRAQHLGRVAVKGGAVQRLVAGERVIGSFASTRGCTAVVAATSTTLPDVYRLHQGELQALTDHNAAWLAGMQLAQVEPIEFRSQDGVQIQGLLTKPLGYRAGIRYPTILWIHGGPYAQNRYSMDFNSQLFAMHGYAVVQVNYRGSSGRGAQFAKEISGDWGNKDLDDVMAGIEHVIGLGVADPDKLGVGGWSQGGILTNFVIAKHTKFKAAISGAGMGNALAMYGSDAFVLQYDHELQPPWVQPERWMKLSYPLLNAHRIKTPTMYVAGKDDFTVPVIGAEQMYQALQSLQVPSQLVIYPGERHSISRRSFRVDLMQRYLAWFDSYLKADAT